MTFANSPNSSNASITASPMRPRTTLSTTDSNPPEPDDYATVIRWIPLAAPLLALLPALSAYFILWSVRVWIP